MQFTNFLRSRTTAFICLATFILSWVWFHQDMLVSAWPMLPRDNYHHLYLAFEYVSNFLKDAYYFPNWDIASAFGMSLEPQANNLLLFLPHRMVGYLMVALFNVPTQFAYKFSLVFIGSGLFLYGIYRLAMRLFNDVWLACLAVALALTSGLCVGFLQQEQALGTVFFVPFIWLTALQCRDNPRKLPLLAAIYGLSLNSHYPQLISGYLFVTVVCAVIAWPAFRSRIREIVVKIVKQKQFGLVLATIVSFIVSASPLIYSYFTYKDTLGSGFRSQKELRIDNFKKYSEFWNQASMNPKNLLLYLDPTRKPVEMGHLEENLVFMSALVVIALALMIVLRKIPNRFFQLLTIFCLGFLPLGFYGPAPRILWTFMPGIDLFRQYLHYISFLNLHLLFAILFVGAALPKKWRIAYFALGLASCVWWGDQAIKRTHNFSLRENIVFSAHPYLERARIPVANPKMVDLDAVFKEHAPYPHGHQFYWMLGKFRPYTINSKDVEFTLSPEGFRLKLLNFPKETRSIRWLQYNDGKWIVKEKGKRRSVRTMLDSQEVMMELPVYDLKREFLITRPLTLWQGLILLMWLPLIFAWLSTNEIRFPVRSARMIPAEAT